MSTARPRVVLGIDLGTTETKAALLTLDGHLLAIGRAGYPIRSDQTGRAEQDPDDWWQAIVRVTRELLGQTPAEVVAISCAGQGPTLVAVDAAGRPARPAITWMDNRASLERSELGGLLPIEASIAGILPFALWIERHEPGLPIAWYLNSWEYVALRLSGRPATAISEGQSVVSADRVAGIGVDAARIPPVVAAGAVLGRLTPEAGSSLGLAAGTPIVGGMNDAYASFLGAGLLERGDAIDTGGTSGGFGVYWDAPVEVTGAFAGAAPIPGRYVVGGAMAATGKALDWLRDDLLDVAATTSELLKEASLVAPGAEGLVFLPYLAGERSPIWDPEARGAFVGLTLGHRRAHLARAVMEAAAMAIRHVAEPILAAGLTVSEMRVCGGPARDSSWNQLKADVTGFDVGVPEILETATVGAAILAGVGIGAYADLPDGIRRVVRIRKRLSPRPEMRAAYDALYATYKDLYPRLAPVFRALGAISRGSAARAPETGSEASGSPGPAAGQGLGTA